MKVKSRICLQNGRFVIDVHSGGKLKEVLKAYPAFSSNFIHSLFTERKIEDGNGNIIKKNRLVKKGDVFKLDFSDHQLSDYKPIEYDLDIVYEDEFFLIINKPVETILFYTYTNDLPCIASYVNYYYVKTGQKHKIRFVNRLDRDTSGILILAKNRFAHNYIFERSTKKYCCIVPEIFKKQGLLNLPLLRNRPFTYVCTTTGKKSVTRYRKVFEGSGFSFLLCKLVTGRTHQIRAHFKFFEHALVGDKSYGGMYSKMAERQFLHCYILKFRHPITNKLMKIKAPLLPDMANFTKKMLVNDKIDFY